MLKDCDEDLEQEFYGNYNGEIKNLIHDTIIRYFSDKSYYCGGKIPKKSLINERNINVVLNYNIENLLPEIYSIIERDYEQVADNVSHDVRLVVKLLKDFSKNNVPKEFSAGMLLIYFENCMGYKFNLIK